MSRDDAMQVPVNGAEYAKFCYLIKAIDAVDRAHDIGKDALAEMRRTEGVEGYVDFDWRGVVNHVTPQLQVVFLKDRERDPYSQAFISFPHTVIVVRNAFVVELDSVFELNLEGHDVHPDVNSATDALRVLEATVALLEGERRVNADMKLRQLQRVLKLEL